MLASATNGPTDGYRENGSTVAPVTTVTQNAVNLALSYQPVLLEYWGNDGTNPALDSTVQSATAAMQAAGGTGGTAGPRGGRPDRGRGRRGRGRRCPPAPRRPGCRMARRR